MKIRRLMSAFCSTVLIAMIMTFHLTGCTTEDDFTGGASGNQPIVIHNIGTLVAPTQREDVTPLLASEIGGYRVYYGTDTGDYTRDIDLGYARDLQDALLSLTPGVTYYFVITVYDTDGRESLFSQEMSISL